MRGTDLHCPGPMASRGQPRRIEAKVKYHPATHQSGPKTSLLDSLLLSSLPKTRRCTKS